VAEVRPPSNSPLSLSILPHLNYGRINERVVQRVVLAMVVSPFLIIVVFMVTGNFAQAPSFIHPYNDSVNIVGGTIILLATLVSTSDKTRTPFLNSLRVPSLFSHTHDTHTTTIEEP
jgi:small neutral amino acid transporter SnatA (MarC family)